MSDDEEEQSCQKLDRKQEKRNLRTNFTLKHLELLKQIGEEQEIENMKKQEHLRMVTRNMAPHSIKSEKLHSSLQTAKNDHAKPRRELSVGYKKITNKHLDTHFTRNLDIGRGLFRNLQTQDMIKFVSRSDFNKARQVQIQDCIRAY